MTTIDRVVGALKEQNLSQGELVKSLNIGKRSIWEAINTLRRLGLIHIDHYRRLPNHQVAVYTFGEGVDAEPLFKFRRVVTKLVIDELFIPSPKLAFWHDHVFSLTQGE